MHTVLSIDETCYIRCSRMERGDTPVEPDGIRVKAESQLSARVRERSVEAWESLQTELAPAMRAGDHEFVAVTAEDVINRNRRQP